MSIEVEDRFSEQDHKVFAEMVENSGDDLTDILVDALYETFRILEDEAGTETFH